MSQGSSKYAGNSRSSSGAIIATSIQNTGLTSGRIPYASAGGLLGDSANLAFDGTNLTSAVRDKGGAVYNVKAYGAKADYARRADGTLVTTTTLSATGYTFVAADVGKVVVVEGKGLAGADLYTTVLSVAAGVATLNNAAASTGSSLVVHFGTDDGPVFNSAIAAASGGGQVFAPAGTYLISTTISLTSTMHLRGAGTATILVHAASSQSADLIGVNVGGGSKAYNIVLGDLFVYQQVNRTAGSALRLGNCGSVLVERVKIQGVDGTHAPYVGIWNDSGTDIVLERVASSSCHSDGLLFQGSSSASFMVDFWINDGCRFDGNGGWGIHLNSVQTGLSADIEGVYFQRISVYGNTSGGIKIEAATGCYVQNIIFQGSILDTNAGPGLWITGAGTGVVKNVYIMDVWSASNTGATGHGMVLDGTALSDYSVQGGAVTNNHRNGIKINGAARGVIRGVDAESNNQANTSTDDSYAFLVIGGTSDVTISACRAWNSTLITYAQNGLKIGSGSYRITATGNVLDTSLAGTLSTTPLYLDPAAITPVVNGNVLNPSQDPSFAQDVRWFGTLGDLRAVADGAYSNGTTLTSATANFLPSDVGKYVVVNGAATPTTVASAGAMTSGTAILTVTGAAFAQTDVGKWISVTGAGAAGATLYTTIAGVTSGTVVTLVDNASTTVTTATISYAGWRQTTIASVTNTTTVVLNLISAANPLQNTSMQSASVYVASDDSPAIANAISATSGQERLEFPAGNYFLASTVTVNKEISFCGAGTNATLFYTASNADTFSVNVAQTTKIYNLLWQDFSIVALSNQTAGAAVKVGNVGQSAFCNIKVSNLKGGRPFDGIVLDQCSQTFFDNIRVSGVQLDGFKVSPGASARVNVDVWVSSLCQFDGNLGDGIRIENPYINGSTQNVQGLYFGACSVYNNSGRGVYIGLNRSVSAYFPTKGFFFAGTILDSNWSLGFYVDDVMAAGLIQNLRLDNCWISFNGNPNWVAGNANHNVWIGAAVSDFVLNGNHVLLAGNNGIVLNGCTRGKIQNNSIFDNSQTASNTYVGLLIQGTTSKCQVQNNRSYNTFSTSNKQGGVFVTAGVTNIDITANFFDTNQGGSATTPRTVMVGAGLREWGNTYDSSTQNLNFPMNLGVGDAITPTYGLHQFGGSYRLQSVPTPGTATASGAITGGTLAAGSYVYWVVAADRAGNKTPSSASGGTGTVASGTTGSVGVSWSAVAGGYTYYVLRKATAPTAGATETILVGSTTANSLTDTGTSLTSFTSASRNATADSTLDGSLTVGTASVAGSGTITLASNTAPTAAQGQQFYDSTQLSKGVGYGASANPLNVWLPGCFYSQYASSTAVTASATNSTLFAGSPSAVGTRILPIGFLVPGRSVRLRVYGIYTSSATIANNAITIKLNLISSTPTTVQLAITPVFTVPVSQTAATFVVDAMFTCRSVGGSGTVFAQGTVTWNTSGVASGTQVTQLNATAVATIDTTKTEQIDITATTGTGASAVTVTNAIMETVN